MQNISAGFDLEFKVFIFMGLYFRRIQVKSNFIAKFYTTTVYPKCFTVRKRKTNAYIKKQNNLNEIQVKYMYIHI